MTYRLQSLVFSTFLKDESCMEGLTLSEWRLRSSWGVVEERQGEGTEGEGEGETIVSM